MIRGFRFRAALVFGLVVSNVAAVRATDPARFDLRDWPSGAAITQDQLRTRYRKLDQVQRKESLEAAEKLALQLNSEAPNVGDVFVTKVAFARLQSGNLARCRQLLEEVASHTLIARRRFHFLMIAVKTVESEYESAREHGLKALAAFDFAGEIPDEDICGWLVGPSYKLGRITEARAYLERSDAVARRNHRALFYAFELAERDADLSEMERLTDLLEKISVSDNTRKAFRARTAIARAQQNETADEDLRRAAIEATGDWLQANPDSTDARIAYLDVLRVVGRHRDALEVVERLRKDGIRTDSVVAIEAIIRATSDDPNVFDPIAAVRLADELAAVASPSYPAYAPWLIRMKAQLKQRNFEEAERLTKQLLELELPATVESDVRLTYRLLEDRKKGAVHPIGNILFGDG